MCSKLAKYNINYFECVDYLIFHYILKNYLCAVITLQYITSTKVSIDFINNCIFKCLMRSKGLVLFSLLTNFSLFNNFRASMLMSSCNLILGFAATFVISLSASGDTQITRRSLLRMYHVASAIFSSIILERLLQSAVHSPTNYYPVTSDTVTTNPSVGFYPANWFLHFDSNFPSFILGI